MTTRTTKHDIEIQAQALHGSALALGLIPEGSTTVVEFGSKTYGQAFRLFLQEAGSTAHHRHPATTASNGFLGMTKREAFNTLHTMNGVLWAVRHAAGVGYGKRVNLSEVVA